MLSLISIIFCFFLPNCLRGARVLSLSNAYQHLHNSIKIPLELNWIPRREERNKKKNKPRNTKIWLIKLKQPRLEIIIIIAPALLPYIWYICTSNIIYFISRFYCISFEAFINIKNKKLKMLRLSIRFHNHLKHKKERRNRCVVASGNSAIHIDIIYIWMRHSIPL